MASKKGADLLRVEAELEEHRRRAAMHGRALGAVVASVGLLLAYVVHDQMVSRAVYSVELLYFSTWLLSAGGILLALGVGGVARIVDVPATMWAALAVVSAVVALIAFIPLGHVLAFVSGYGDL